MTTPLFTLEKLTVPAPSSPGTILLTELTLTIPQGELVAIAGPSGAGKSTLLRQLVGLGEPSHGTLHFLGRPLKEYTLASLAKKRAYLPQNEQVSEEWTVEQLVGLGLVSRAPFSTLSPGEQEAVRALLEQLGLRALAHRYFTTLSGGEKRRVLFARAMCQSSQVLLLDEPTAFLDWGQSLRFLQLLRRIHQRHGTSMVVVTHDLNAILNGFHRVLLLKGGRLLGSGPPREVLAKWGSEAYAAPFVVEEHPRYGAQACFLQEEEHA